MTTHGIPPGRDSLLRAHLALDDGQQIAAVGKDRGLDDDVPWTFAIHDRPASALANIENAEEVRSRSTSGSGEGEPAPVHGGRCPNKRSWRFEIEPK